MGRARGIQPEVIRSVSFNMSQLAHRKNKKKVID
jgi:hypothetical protein